MPYEILFRTTLIVIFAGILVQTTAFVSIPYSTKYKYIDSLANGQITFRPRANFQKTNEEGASDADAEILRILNDEMLQTDETISNPFQNNVFETDNDIDTFNEVNVLRKLHEHLENEQDLVTKSAILIEMLEDPTLDTLPIVYVEENDPTENISNEVPILLNHSTNINKRSRYYRRYPWKRHNRNRSTYDPELRYACTPSKEDVFKLLVNLHENRNGRNGKTINFCNRKRPARAVFTNLRFLG